MRSLHIVTCTRFFALLLLPLLFAGCLRDNLDSFEKIGDDPKGLTLNLAVPGMETVTRAGMDGARENEVRTVRVAVFESSGQKAFIGVYEGTKIHTSATNISQIHIPSVGFTGDFDVVVVANADAVVTSAITAATGEGGDSFTKAQFLKHLKYENRSPWAAKGANPAPLPMYGEASCNAGDFKSGSSVSVKMTRVHARIDVVLEDANSDIYFINLYNYMRNTPLRPNYEQPLEPSLTTAPVRSGIHYQYSVGDSEASPYKSLTGSIYVFESPATDDSSLSAHVSDSFYMLLCLVHEGQLSYYRLDMTWDGSIQGTTKGAYMPILRNYKYTVRIREVLGPGYSTADEAREGKTENNNLSYTIHTEDQGRFNNLSYDGNYILGASTFDMWFSGDYQKHNIEVTSNHHDRWTAMVTEGGGWLKVAQGSVDDPLTWDDGVHSTVSTGLLGIEVQENTDTNGRTGVITITSGRLSVAVEVYQSIGSAVSINFETDSGQTNIESLAFGYNNGGQPVPKRGLMVRWTPKEADLVVSHKELGSKGGFGYTSDSDDLGDYTKLTGGAAIFKFGPPERDPLTESGTYCTQYEFSVSFQGVTKTRTLGLIQSVPQTYSAAANCYMVPPATIYGGHTVKFPLTQATKRLDGAQISAADSFRAELLWTDAPDPDNGNKGLSAGAALAKIETVQATSRVEDKYIVVTPGTREGNAVVVLYKGASGTTPVWSWHIWVTNYQPGRGAGPTVDTSLPVSPAVTAGSSEGVRNGRIYRYAPGRDNVFMDRNLGAAGVSMLSDGYINLGGAGLTAEKAATFGLTYQWGRKDPFPGAANYGSNTQKPLYNTAGSQLVFVRQAAGRSSRTSNNYATSVENPTILYYNNTSADDYTYDWYTGYYYASDYGANRRDDLWGNNNAKAASDPCPPGWRIPEAADALGSSYSGREGSSTGYIPIKSGSSRAYALPSWEWNHTNSPWNLLGGTNKSGFDGGYDFGPGLGWYPAAGFRPSGDGILTNVGTAGAYWNGGTVGTANIYRFYLATGLGFGLKNSTLHDDYATQYNNHDNYISANNEYGRCRGFSVRCVQDD